MARATTEFSREILDSAHKVFGWKNYSIKHKCECEHEFDHVPPCKLEGQGGYSDGSKAFKYDGTDHDPMTHSHPPSREELRITARGEKEFYQTNGWDYETGEFIYNEKW